MAEVGGAWLPSVAANDIFPVQYPIASSGGNVERKKKETGTKREAEEEEEEEK